VFEYDAVFVRGLDFVVDFFHYFLGYYPGLGSKQIAVKEQ
jgi:hypothetical protein